MCGMNQVVLHQCCRILAPGLMTPCCILQVTQLQSRAVVSLSPIPSDRTTRGVLCSPRGMLLSLHHLRPFLLSIGSPRRRSCGCTVQHQWWRLPSRQSPPTLPWPMAAATRPPMPYPRAPSHPRRPHSGLLSWPISAATPLIPQTCGLDSEGPVWGSSPLALKSHSSSRSRAVPPGRHPNLPLPLPSAPHQIPLTLPGQLKGAAIRIPSNLKTMWPRPLRSNYRSKPA